MMRETHEDFFTSPRLRGEVAPKARVRGSLQEHGAWRLPLTPTLSPHAGRGSRASTGREAAERATLRRFAESRGEVLQPRQHLVAQQMQRALPGLRLVLVVEAEHQQ